MARTFVVAMLIFTGYAWHKGWVAELLETPQAREARLAAEQAALAKKRTPLADEPAQPMYWNTDPPPAPRPHAAMPVLRDFPNQPGGLTPCDSARSLVAAGGQWMQTDRPSNYVVYEKGSGRVLSHNETFDGVAKARQYIADNCR